jgi:phosphopantetheinyl transferase (holo-ACP synthase)
LPVGNDVVDLRDPESQPAAIHPRFDSRVFTADELRLLDAASPAARHALRWTLWAAKESTFKLLRQHDESIPFHPRAFAVELTGDDSAVVTAEGTIFYVSLDVTEERVHAVCSPQADDRPPSAVDQADDRPVGREASRRVRASAARAVGERLGVEARDIVIEGRIPRVLTNGRRLPVDLSLSHHGRFLAHAFEVENAADL